MPCLKDVVEAILAGESDIAYRLAVALGSAAPKHLKAKDPIVHKKRAQTPGIFVGPREAWDDSAEVIDPSRFRPDRAKIDPLVACLFSLDVRRPMGVTGHTRRGSIAA